MSPAVAAYVALGDRMLREGEMALAADFYETARRVLRLERRRGVWMEVKKVEEWS